MGNSLALCTTERKLQEKQKLLLQVMNMDGKKMLEFNTSVLVKDLLAKYPTSYVGLFKEATQPLPPNYKLKVGKIYYLLPNYYNSAHDDHLHSRALERNLRSLVARSVDDDKGKNKKKKNINVEGPKRVKVLLTKEQLQRLISKRMEMGDHDLVKRRCRSIESIMPSILVPKLEAVPERVESF